MFTVLHKLDGKERVFKTVRVEYLDFNQYGDSGGVHLSVGPDQGGPGIECGQIIEGDVFIMNDQGATVAKWFMGPKELRRSKRPTIAELEAILNSKNDRNVRVNPDGSVTQLSD